ncbi:MAG: dienelactone hydrolase family protein [Alphaproteobacteria bacterium]|nr:dienelactone hydrolase family protein [Alphaproteobacteria bacterium]
MPRRLAFAIGLVVVLLTSGAGRTQELVHFASLAQPSVELDGYLFRPPGEGRHPAIVFLHGCGGLLSRSAGTILQREQAWAAEFNRRGYVVLMVDSFRPRGIEQMCAPATYNESVAAQRPKDAYAALGYLQAQPFIRGDRIGVIGWSQGGGTVLWTIPAQGLGRPAALPQGDFRAAVAFYPALCNDRRQPAGWTTSIPLLVLTGAADVWTPLAPCQSFLQSAASRGAPVELQAYPGAYHDFDSPNQPLREYPQYRMTNGVVPILATDPAARADAFARVPAFLARYLEN